MVKSMEETIKERLWKKLKNVSNDLKWEWIDLATNDLRKEGYLHREEVPRVDEEEIVKLYLKREGLDNDDTPEELIDWIKDFAKAICTHFQSPASRPKWSEELQEAYDNGYDDGEKSKPSIEFPEEKELKRKEYAIKRLIKQNHKIGESLNEQAQRHKQAILEARIEECENFIKCDTLGPNTRRAIKTYIAQLTKELEGGKG